MTYSAEISYEECMEVTKIKSVLGEMKGKKTLVIIAHRLQTIEKCDMVYRVEDGKAVLEKGR